eukprot:GHRR01035304.1.p1 GENE.GHRR01035304.1~~GHRR01035304.1.p1  ORF type:complete len:151 (+),score=28.94 GHRR01035304.1:171-623(+)
MCQRLLILLSALQRPSIPQFMGYADATVSACCTVQVMTVIPFDTDEQAIAIANDCAFGLGSSVFSGNLKRARHIGQQLEAGMTSINDFNATYMCQGLPFGGVKYSGFGRFGGVEGLRALCIPKVGVLCYDFGCVLASVYVSCYWVCTCFL